MNKIIIMGNIGNDPEIRNFNDNDKADKGGFSDKKAKKNSSAEDTNNREFDPSNKQEYRKKKRLETYGITD